MVIYFTNNTLPSECIYSHFASKVFVEFEKLESINLEVNNWLCNSFFYPNLKIDKLLSQTPFSLPLILTYYFKLFTIAYDETVAYDDTQLT